MNFQKKSCIAMLLAGGQGSRLLSLTKSTAKPAVAFGGKYRIIDFPLSNCVNSGIDTVGILTQYQPLELNEYIGNGAPWGLNKNHGGVLVLPPYQRADGSDWYKGTANAIYQNIKFIDRYDPDNVLILSGDHIYRMDYAEMIEFHKQSNSDCTIAVRDVPLSEASRFGIMNTNPDGTIYEFEEKPKQPKSTNASMGIYVFKWEALRKYLIDDEANPNSENDFGKNIIPAMLNDGKKLMAFSFNDYWKDVGTILSLWEANMDLLGENPAFPISGKKKIYARNPCYPSAYLGPTSKIENSMVCDGSFIHGEVKNSIISTGCMVGYNAVVENSIIMPDASVEDGATVKNAIIGEGTVVCADAHVGAAQILDDNTKRQIAVIGNNHKIASGTIIKPGEVL